MLYDIPQAEKYCDGSRCMQKEKIATTSIESIYACYDISNRIYILGKNDCKLMLGRSTSHGVQGTETEHELGENGETGNETAQGKLRRER
jgi:hypothetical protein